MKIGLRDSRFARDAWLRRCQECGNVQAMKSPEGQKTDNWRDAKCRKCKSEGSLDYGTPNEYVEDEDDDESIGETIQGIQAEETRDYFIGFPKKED